MNKKIFIIIFILITLNMNLVLAKTAMSFKVGKDSFRVEEEDYSIGIINDQFAGFLSASSKTDTANLFLGITNPKKGKKYKLTSTNQWMSDEAFAGFGIGIQDKENTQLESVDNASQENQLNGSLKISKIKKDGTIIGKFKLRANTFIEPSNDDIPSVKDDNDEESSINIQKGKFNLKPSN